MERELLGAAGKVFRRSDEVERNSEKGKENAEAQRALRSEEKKTAHHRVHGE